MRTRINFSAEARHVIAARAGFRCSYPGCGRLTIGPAKSPNDFENNGFASHIYSASDDGPRGKGGLAPEQIKLPTNGIWMCGDHESLIDKKNGIRFPVSVLQSWKALHEFRTSYEMSGKQAAFGFARTLMLERSPMFEPGSVLELAKTTFLIGGNGSGKTAICDWLATLGTTTWMRRWLGSPDLRFQVEFDAPASHKLEVSTTSDGLELRLDGRPVSRNFAGSTIVFLRNRGEPSIGCHLRRLMDLFGIDELALRSVVGRVSDWYVRAMRFEPREIDEEERSESVRRSRDDLEFDLTCDVGQEQTYSYAQLSGGEQGRVLVAIAMELAREAVQFGPVILIIELKELGMDWRSTQPYLEAFASAECLFQTLVTSWELPAAMEMLGWQVYQLPEERAESRTISPVLFGP